jgi:hypothetical protein
MASSSSAAAGQQHKGEHRGSHHRSGPHHLSSKVSTDHEGWAEGIVSLTEEHTATELLHDNMTVVGGSAVAPAAAAAATNGHRAGAQPGSCAGSANGGSGGDGNSTAALQQQLGALVLTDGMSAEEERRARLEHALKSLEVEVVQRGELLADLGGWVGGCAGGRMGGWVGGWPAGLHVLCMWWCRGARRQVAYPCCAFVLDACVGTHHRPAHSHICCCLGCLAG